MTLRTRALLVALVSAMVLLVLLGVFLTTYQEHARVERNVALTEALSVRTSRLRTALFDYLLQPQPDRRSRVADQFEDFDGLLEREASAVAESIRNDALSTPVWASVRRLAGDLQAQIAEGRGPETDPGHAERDRRNADRILEDSHALAISVSQLRERAVAGLLATTAQRKARLGYLTGRHGWLGARVFPGLPADHSGPRASNPCGRDPHRSRRDPPAPQEPAQGRIRRIGGCLRPDAGSAPGDHGLARSAGGRDRRAHPGRARPARKRRAAAAGDGGQPLCRLRVGAGQRPDATEPEHRRHSGLVRGRVGA